MNIALRFLVSVAVVAVITGCGSAPSSETPPTIIESLWLGPHGADFDKVYPPSREG